MKNGTEGISDEMLILRKKRTSTKLRSDILWIDSTKKLISVLPRLRWKHFLTASKE